MGQYVNAFQGAAAEHTSDKGDLVLVGGTKAKWRREFNDPLAVNWDTAQPVAGIALPDPAGGVLTIAMGTTPSAESQIISKKIFSFPLRLRVALDISQKIVNNEIYVEFVGCDANGNLDETRIAAWRIAGNDSTSTTVGRAEVRNGQAARRQSGNIGTPTQTTAGLYEIVAESDEIWFQTASPDSANSMNAGQPMNLVAPDPEGFYKVRIRFVNGSVAPASSTTVRVYHALCLDQTELNVKVQGGDGATGGGQATPVFTVNQAAVSLRPNAAANQFNTTSLAAGATYTGATWDNGSGSIDYQGYRVSVLHTAGLTPGTLIYEESVDNATFVETLRIPIPSDGLVHTFEFPISMRAARVKFTNGATAQTNFRITMAAIRIANPSWGVLAKNLAFPLSTTVLAANASFTSATFDLGNNHPWAEIRALAFSDQPGTMNIDVSRDGANWRIAAEGGQTSYANIAANELRTLRLPIGPFRYYRFRYANGATLQGVFSFDASLVSL